MKREAWVLGFAIQAALGCSSEAPNEPASGGAGRATQAGANNVGGGGAASNGGAAAGPPVGGAAGGTAGDGG